MKHSGKIKKTALASVLAASMIVSMFNFGNVSGRKSVGKGRGLSIYAVRKQCYP